MAQITELIATADVLTALGESAVSGHFDLARLDEKIAGTGYSLSAIDESRTRRVRPSIPRTLGDLAAVRILTLTTGWVYP